MNTDSKRNITKGELLEELRRIEKKFEKRFKLYANVKAFRFAMQQIDEQFCSREEKYYTKDDHSLDMIWMDEAMAEIRDAREERKLRGHQLLRLDDTIVNHEKRICILEK